MRSLGLIWAQSSSGIIGRDGGIPWRLPEDQARFKQLTLGHTVVMGRGTWESLPAAVRPLPGRRNVVLTRRADYRADGAQVVDSLDAALAAASAADDIWVIGGQRVYQLALPRAQRCEVTEIDLDLPRRPGDALAPVLDDGWRVSAGSWQTGSGGLRYRFCSYRR